MAAVPVEWLTQPVTVPLWAFLLALLLPANWLARQARAVIRQRTPDGDAS